MKAKASICKSIISIILISLSSYAYSEEVELNKEEIIKLFSNKTYEGYNHNKDSKFSVYDATDGHHTVKNWKGKIRLRYWRVNPDGEYCTGRKKDKGGKCTKIIANGDGTYKRINQGDHIHTLKNFRDGDQL